MSDKAFIAKLDSLESIPNAKTIQVAYVLGTPVIVSQDYEVDTLGIFFPEGLQLSEDYCSQNNLYRHSILNKDQDKSGFFEDSRRVRAQPFMKVKSEGLFMPMESLVFCGENAYINLQLGDQLSSLNDYELCKKYISPQTKRAMANVKKNKSKASESPMFHQHMSTDQFRYYGQNIPRGALVSLHHKLHGTSARYSHAKVIRNPESFSVWEIIKESVRQYFCLPKKDEWQYLVGTRRVTLYEDQYDKEGFHGSEQFRFDWLEKLKPYLDKGLTVYGEIVGYANGSPIMARHNTGVLRDRKLTKKFGEEVVYKYGCVENSEQNSNRFFIYRISMTNEDGIELDFSVEQLIAWCQARGFEHTQLIEESYSWTDPMTGGKMYEPTTFIYGGNVEALKAHVEFLTEREEHLCADPIDPSHPYEGVVIRVDYQGLKPKFYKQKSYVFRVLEGHCEAVDVEDAN